MTNQWNNQNSKELFEAFLQLDTVDELARFCRDLMTESEIAELSGRWQAAKRLSLGDSQRKVSSDTGVSIATVTRVNHWLHKGMGGYRMVLDRMNRSEMSGKHHAHQSELDPTS